MNCKPVFSIVVPVYNVEAYLDRCVQSLIGQTFSDIEIILVNDGSTDRSGKMCDEYASQDERIKVLHKQNGGLSDARNRGLDIAIGAYVIFVDSDDYIESNACGNFFHYVAGENDILIGDAIVEGGTYNLSHIELDGVVSGNVYYKAALKSRRMPIVAWINAYRRDFLISNNLRFKYGILHEDVEFTPRAFLAAQTVVYTKNLFYHYVLRDNSITSKKDQRKNAENLYETCCEHEKRFREIEDIELQELLLDSLVKSYLSLFQAAKLYQYGKDYIHKDFCLRNAYATKTKMKSALLSLSPRLYWHLNDFLKSGCRFAANWIRR